MPDIEIDAGRFATLNTMIQAENLQNQSHYREVLSKIVSPNSALQSSRTVSVASSWDCLLTAALQAS